MATLEKIRSKSVLLVVIIALALLAFILGDAITNGRNLFGNNTTVAKVGKEKIDIQEYQQQRQKIEEARKLGFYNDIQDEQLVGHMALQELMSERMVKAAAEELGIKSSPELLRYYMIENPIPTPEMASFMTNLQQMGLPVTSIDQAYTIIFQPQTVGLTERQVEPFQRAWIAMEAKYNDYIISKIYQDLLSNTNRANKLDIAAMRNDYAQAATVRVAKKALGEIDEKAYSVSDDELKKAYEERKEVFKLDETTKEISFITVDVLPSANDKEAAKQLANKVITELRTPAGLTKETQKNGLDVQEHETSIAAITNGSLKIFLQNAPVDSVAMLSNNDNGFNAVKLLDREVKVDSLQISVIQVMDNGNLVARVTEYANSGLPLDSINTVFGDSVMYNKPEWRELYPANGMTMKNLGLEEEVYETLFNSNGQYVELMKEQGVALLGTVAEKSSPKEIVKYETVDYTLHPSEGTIADAREKLQKFLTANNTAEKFEKNAKSAGYTAEEMAISPSLPAIPQNYMGFYPDSRSLVRWIVVDGKDGEVSKIYQTRDLANPRLYAAAIVKTYKDYMPWDSRTAKKMLSEQVRRQKAGESMVKQYSKGSVDEAAEAMGEIAMNIPAIKAGNTGGVVTDAKVRGRIMGSKASDKVQVVNGDDGVYAYVITEVRQDEIPENMTDEQFEQIFLGKHQFDPFNALRGKKKVEINIYKFEQGE